MTKTNMTTNTLGPKQRTEILASVKKCILKQHFNVGGVNYSEWAKRFDQRSPSLLGVDIEEFEDGVRKALAELASSHTVFYHDRTNRLLPQHSINATIRAFGPDGQQRWHFLDVFEGGPAHLAGIKPGDMLVAVDGTPYAPPTMPPFRIGETHKIAVSSAPGENSREITVSIPFRKGTKDRPPIVEPKSPIHRVAAPKTGLLKIPFFPGPTGISFANALDVAMRNLSSQGCDRLIIDLRGNIGGSLGFARLASYLCAGRIPIGHSLTPTRLRKGYTRDSLPRVPMPRTTSEFMLALARFALRDKSVNAPYPRIRPTAVSRQGRHPRERMDQQRSRDARELRLGEPFGDDHRHQNRRQCPRSCKPESRRRVLATRASLRLVHTQWQVPRRPRCLA